MKVTPDIVKNYRELALRTLSAASFLDKDPELYCTTNQLHAAIGLVTEIQEIKTDASKQEEISDSSWFLNLAADSVDADFAAMVHEATINVRRNLLATSSLAADGQMDKLNRAAIHLLDCAKASIYYGRKEHKNFLPKGEKLSWRDTVLNDVKAAAEAVAYLCVIWKIDIYETLEKNIAKLALRYPEKFDTDKASNRDVGKELGVFAGKVGMISLPIGTVIANPNAMVKGTITDDEVKSALESEDSVIATDEVMPPETASILDESVVIEEIPAEDIPADIQKKMDEVGAAFDKHLSREGFRPEIAEAAEELANSEEGKLFGEESVKASKEAIVGNEVEFNAEKLVEAVEETAEEAKVDKKKPGRKKNN